MADTAKLGGSGTGSESQKQLSPEALRALAEAEARRQIRKAEEENAPSPPCEINGRGGLDPVRYGDWEIKGLICDF